MRVRDERGVAATVAVALTALLLLLGATGAGVGALFAAHRRVAAAADLAALAAAAAQQSGEDPCLRAAQVSTANGATLADCTTDPTSVTVTTRLRPPGLLAGKQVHARARAGVS